MSIWQLDVAAVTDGAQGRAENASVDAIVNVERMLLRPTPAMFTRIAIGLIIVATVALTLASFGGSLAPSVTPAKSAATPLGAGRFFMLLPDGRVEISDAWSRRVYRWDGHRWLQLEVVRREAPPAEMR